jgi:hypothetical protein
VFLVSVSNMLANTHNMLNSVPPRKSEHAQNVSTMVSFYYISTFQFAFSSKHFARRKVNSG